MLDITKLHIRFSLQVFLIGFIVLTSISLLYYFTHRTSVIQHAKESIMQDAIERAEHVNMILDSKINVAQILTETPVLRESLLTSNTEYAALENDARQKRIATLNKRWMETKDPSDPFIASYLKNPVANYVKQHQELHPGEYGEIFLTNKYGALVGSTGRLTTLAHSHKYWWKASYYEGNGRPFCDDRGFDTSADGYVLGITVPVISEGEIIGILKNNVNVFTFLDELIKTYHPTIKSKLVISRSGGTIVLEEGVEPLTTEVSTALKTVLQKKEQGFIVFKEKEGEQLYGYAPIALTLGTSEYGFGGNYGSIDHIMGNKGESWIVLISQDMDDALAPLYKESLNILKVGFTVLSLLILLAWYMGRRMAKPILEIQQSMMKIASGDFDVDIPANRRDEIGNLVRSFNQMATSLKETTTSRDKLQKEIALRKLSEQYFKESEKRFKRLTEAAQEGIALTIEGKIIDANPAFCKMFDYHYEEILNKSSIEFVTPEFYAIVREKIAQNDETPYEVQGMRKNGSQFPCEVIGRAILTKGVPGRVTILRDVTLRKEHEEELQHAKEKAEDATKLKDQFVSLVAHDLKSPIGGIKTMLEVIKMEHVEDFNQEDMKSIDMLIGHCDRICKTVEELLNISRLKTGKLVPKVDAIKIKELVNYITLEFVQDAQNKKIQIFNELEEGFIMQGDSVLLGEVLKNLISNALKFTPEKGEIIIFHPKRDEYNLAIQDNGTGVSKNIIKDLFKHEVQTVMLGLRGERGTGLGLPYSHDIIEAHNGEMVCESVEGEGTTFLIKLPTS